MKKVYSAGAAALGLSLALSAPPLANAGVTPGPGLGNQVGNSEAVSGQQNCLGQILSESAKGEGLGVIGMAEGETGAEVILPVIAIARSDAAAGEGECDEGE